MGFPNVDLQLVKIFLAGFAAAKADPTVIDDLFEDLDDTDRAAIKQYLASLTVTDDVRQRKEHHRYLYLLPHFPLSGYPFPQIGVSLGTEDSAERFISDYTGDPVPVTDQQGTLIGYDQEKGYLGQGHWNIDVVSATKPESIWLSRFCQLFICESQDYLTGLGIQEVSVALGDIKLEAQQTMQPSEIFNRGVRVSAKVANTWKKRLPINGDYQTGINQALA